MKLKLLDCVVRATAGSALAPGRPEAPRHLLRHQAPPTAGLREGYAGPGQISSRGRCVCLEDGSADDSNVILKN